MRQVAGCVAAMAMIWLGLAAAQTKKPATKQPHKSAAKKGTPAARTTATAAGKKGTAHKTASKRPAVTWRNRQSVPTPERYREIQNALVSRGYLSPEQATGTWDQNSMDALKRFQSEQNIESSGKINSLSLIALGLGPKHEDKVVLPKPQNDPAGQ